MGTISKENFLEHVTNLRKANKNKWYYYTATVEGKPVHIKGYNTWLQIFRVSGIQQNTYMDITVKEFNQTILSAF